jgi:excinuclease ABC subunit C
VAGLAKQNEELFIPNRPDSILLPRTSQGLYLIQRVRDEAHRFAIRYHRRRAQQELVASGLLEIPGVGPVRVQRLWQGYENLAALKAATVEELAALPGFTRQAAQAVKDWLSREGDGPTAAPAPE